MLYDRIKRSLSVEIMGAAYTLRLSLGMIGEVESAIPGNDSLSKMLKEKRPPRYELLKKAFCIGLYKDGERVRGNAAVQVFEQFVTEYGVPEAENIFYGLLAVTNYFGPVASRLILVELGWEKPDELEDKKAEEEEKNV